MLKCHCLKYMHRLIYWKTSQVTKNVIDFDLSTLFTSSHVSSSVNGGLLASTEICTKKLPEEAKGCQNMPEVDKSG